MRICFVCLGNICRSPTAEAVMANLISREGLDDQVEVRSAGTAGYHVGEPPDGRSAAAAARRGVTLRGRAEQFQAADFARFDLVLAMDRKNHDHLRRLAPNEGARSKVFLLRSFDPSSPAGAEVPDPYYGGEQGFDAVLDICEAACAGVLRHLREDHGVGR